MRRYVLVIFIFMLGLSWKAYGPNGLGQGLSAHEDCGFVQNVYGQRISWKGQLPITLKIHVSVPQEMVPAIYEAVDVWNQTLQKRIFEITEHHLKGPVLSKKDTHNVVYWSYQWEAKNSDEQARTNVYWVGDEIRESDIMLNAQDNSFYFGHYTTAKDIDLVSVMVHEFGHVLGLKHNDARRSIMATYLNPLQERREIPKNDVESVSCEYDRHSSWFQHLARADN